MSQGAVGEEFLEGGCFAECAVWVGSCEIEGRGCGNFAEARKCSYAGNVGSTKERSGGGDEGRDWDKYDEEQGGTGKIAVF